MAFRQIMVCDITGEPITDDQYITHRMQFNSRDTTVDAAGSIDEERSIDIVSFHISYKGLEMYFRHGMKRFAKEHTARSFSAAVLGQHFAEVAKQ